MASYLSNEPVRLEKSNIPYTILDPMEYGFDFYDDILTTTAKFEKEHPALTRDFCEATIIKEVKILKKLAYDAEGKIGTLDTQYNDHYGHAMGDEALIKVATVLQDKLKRPSDVIARYGGEEFVILLKNMDKQHTIRFANSLVDEIHKLHISHEFSYVSQYLTISVGVAYKSSHEYILKESFLKKADDALYQAKDGGRNQAVMYQEPTLAPSS